MKAVLALAASLSLASASSLLLPRQLDSLPPCALNCALGSLPDTGCQTTDFACICQATAFIGGLVPCVRRDCTADQLQGTIEAASALCASAGVTLSIPPGVVETGAASSSAPASTSEAASTETEASTTAPPAETTTAATTAETSMASTTEAPATTVPGNATQTTTGTGTRPPTATGTEPGAASRNTVALGGLGAIVALVAAFL